MTMNYNPLVCEVKYNGTHLKRQCLSDCNGVALLISNSAFYNECNKLSGNFVFIPDLYISVVGKDNLPVSIIC